MVVPALFGSSFIFSIHPTIFHVEASGSNTVASYDIHRGGGILWLKLERPEIYNV